MQIDYNILITYGGVAKKYTKGELIFQEGSKPLFIYQIIEGDVKLYSTNTEGKDLIQGIFHKGQTFGEPPLIIDKPYPSSALSISDCVLVKISKEKFWNILDDYPDILKKIFHTFAVRIYHKASSAQVWVSHTPEEKIIQFLNHFVCKANKVEKQLVPYTRQQIADFTGLRVETVIRTLIKISKKGKVDIIKRKIYY